MQDKPLQICIDTRGFVPATAGGVGQVTLGLARGLSSLAGEDRYIFLATEETADWLAPYLAGPCSLHRVPTPRRAAAKRLMKSWAAELALQAPARRLAHRLRRLRRPCVPNSDGTLERLGSELVHFIHQDGVLTALPSIYHPHDLQHIHLPNFFTPWQRAHRAVFYTTLCRQARAVAVTSSWTAEDVSRNLGVPRAKIAVVPFAPPTAVYEPPDPQRFAALRQRIGFPRFILYPAQTWPHKNHLNLLAALKLLDDRGLTVPLVCTGHQTEFFRTIAARIKELRLGDQTLFLGHIPEAEVKCVFELSTFVVVPTRFEAASGPVWEAFAAGKTVAASAVTSLPRQVGGGGLLFDPDDVVQMADCIARLWSDEGLRQHLAQQGYASVQAFTWPRTARHFRALYREILGRSLGEEDRAILAAPPLL